MKFKVGDKVRVRKDLRPGYEYCMDSYACKWNATWEMCDFAGKELTICYVHPQYYRVLECDRFVWTDEMFEAVPVKDESDTNAAHSAAEFKVGDRVKCLKSDDNRNVVGEAGTVIDHHMVTGVPLVEFDVDIDGHFGLNSTQCRRSGRVGHCWYCKPCELELIAESQVKSDFNQKIIITSDGKESTATLYDGDKEIKSAKSVMPKDVGFEFMSYAKSALKHLIKECSRSNSAANARYPNGTVVCIENNLDKSAFTIGKAYNVADGEINDNTGFWRELNWLNNDPTSGFCVYNTEDGPLVKFVVFTGPAEIK